MPLRLLRRCNFLSINLLQNLGPATPEKFAGYLFSERVRIKTSPRLSQQDAPVGTRDHSLQLQLSVVNSRVCTDGNLATSAELAQQRSLAVGFGARGPIAQECKSIAHGRISGADLDCQSSLAGSRTHFIDRNNFSHQFGSLKPLQTCGCKDDCIVLA